MATADESCEATDSGWSVEVALGRAFEGFYVALDDQIGLLREAVPVVAARLERWHDVRNLAPEFKISEHKVDEFVDLWQQTFGTVSFGAVRADNPPTAEDESHDEPGHEPATQPEGSADYREAVTRFIYEHGSFLEFQRVIREFWRVPLHMVTLARSSILFAVAALERAIGDIERTRLREHLGAAGTDKKEFSLDDLIRLGDLDAVIDEAIEKRIENLLYGNLEQWNSWCQGAFKVSLEEFALDWPRMQELVQRRHLIAHNDSRVSRLYLERAGIENPDLSVGDPLVLTPDYTFGALEDTSVLGLRLLLHAWGKLGDDPEHIRQHLRNRSYDSLVSERWHVALVLSKALAEMSPPGSPDAMIGLVNGWLARRGLGEDISAEAEGWDVGALSLRYKAAKAALVDDFEALGRLVPAAVKAGDLHRSEILTWPLFRTLRGEAVFAEILAEVEPGGEPPEAQSGTDDG